MNIGVDYRLANRSHRGMARYCQEITRCLLNMDHNNHYLLFVDSEVKQPLFYENVRYVKLSTQNYIIGEQLLLPLQVRKFKCDVFWSPNNTFPVLLPKRTRLLTTIHDLIFFYSNIGHQSLYQKIGKLYRKIILKLFFRRIDVCFTVSNFSKQEIRKRLGYAKDIIITPNCIDSFKCKVVEFNKHNPTSHGDFFFTLSGDAPSKNLQTLIEVFKNEFPQEKIIIGGLKDDSSFRTFSTNNIIFLPAGVSDETLIRNYLECKCFLFCSKFEGFGIPIIEAAICGAPIIAANTTSIPEILRGNGILVQPTYEGIKVGITKFLQSPESCKRNYQSIIQTYGDWHKPAELILNAL